MSGRKNNRIWKKLFMKQYAAKWRVFSAIAIAWAIAKGTTPIIGVTKPTHVEDAAKAAVMFKIGKMEKLSTDIMDNNTFISVNNTT